MKKIAVEKGLKPVKDYLADEGYSVKEFDNSKKTAKNFLNKFDAVVVKGEDLNVMGIQDTITKSIIMNADGKTPENIKSEIESTIE
ncbi:hypothetical protein CLTEP_23080 [Clostridium tepidiprofundi DSM 19306]|uniref:YkuS family protein n=1 Tax=Clostridium tepidiprofundi DSM 19306 TaxID=1121338 RepID=A0A151AW61_9CLOT|nr:YkuS family protein [Clostridium tepidiprofundi]KYH31904.1 hypothetical protein CLTEP_23080 [Clostridium tepidiprofundi DSM 19306]